jgi:copper chaperone CopZ
MEECKSKNNQSKKIVMTEKITVENIKCGGCMNSIKTAMLKIANVQEIHIDRETDTISINSSLPFERNLIVNQLAKIGYPEKGSNNLLHKAKSFMSCAIGNLTQNK